MPISIKGKEYTTVAERIAKLNAITKGEYDLSTEVLSSEKNTWVIKATLTIRGRGVYTGHASEINGSNFINSTSALENAETSAIGRALASAGFFGSEFCSADELITAIKNSKPMTQQSTQQSASKPEIENIKIASKADVEKIEALISLLGSDKGKIDSWLKKNQIASWAECPQQKISKMIDLLSKKLEDK